MSDIESKLETMQKTKKTLEDKLKKAENELKTGKIEYDKKVSELGIDLQVRNSANNYLNYLNPKSLERKKENRNNKNK